MRKLILSLLLFYTLPVWAGDFFLKEGHLYKSTSQGAVKVEKGLPWRQIYPFKERESILFTALAQVDSQELYVASPFQVFHSVDRGETWETVVHRKEFGRYAYITALGASKDRLVVGTSFHGLFQTEDRGKSWNDLSEAFTGLSPGAGYFDDISSLSLDEENNIYVSCRLGSELYLYRSSTAEVTQLPWAGTEKIRNLNWTSKGLSLETDMGRYLLTQNEFVKKESWDHKLTLSPEAQARRELAKGKNGMYISAWQAKTRLDEHIAFAKEKGLNALVIDFKDDLGRVTYNSQLPIVKEAGALYPWLDLKEITAKTKEAGLYLIARQVVFKDPKLYEYKDSVYALWDNQRKAPWGQFHKVTDPDTGEERLEQREFWVDAYAQEVWDYNIAISKELEAGGVDEVQFDYIRFPSDGPVHNITFRHQRDGMDRMDALESFLKKSRESLSLPIGTDVFGFNGWYVMDYLGQNIQRISQYVDVISPMTYPSHFHKEFMRGEESYNQWAEKIYFTGTSRAVEIVRNQALIRPYVQAFLIYKELRMEEPEYTDYLHKQLEGNKRAGGSGFLLWNASGRYYMVKRDLSEYADPEG